ncbi:MAG TPA: ATP-binding protein [Gemmataceae bacterium]|jgi:signal transduction histidine kinase/CheY-like chemotaxis protein
MSKPLLKLEIRLEQDVVLARQRARQVAGLLGFERQDQTRIATVVSEIARNAFQYAGGGFIEFSIETNTPAALVVRVSDRGPGIKDLAVILAGRYSSPTGMGVGILGARRLMDRFEIDTAEGTGTRVVLAKDLPRRAPLPTPTRLAGVAEELARRTPHDPFTELRRQNQELVQALEELKRRQDELSQVNRELADTNRGVVALYAELDEKADYLRRVSEMKSSFLSNMSHEFRTPVNSILSLARILLDRLDGELSAEQEKQVAFIRRAAEDLAELVNDLLDLAKVEAGKVSVRPQPFEAAELFGALRGMLRPLLAHNPTVSLVFDDPVDVPSLVSDESKVSQILRNFISNALKFTERGEVRVSAARGSQDTVVFSVADTGIGIAPEDREIIFQEFTQLDSARQKRVKGTGLGLPLSRRLAELLGGGIDVSGALGAGSTFALTIPRVYQGPQEVAFVPAVSPRLDPARLPVLVVEDNAETLFIYEKYLKGTGFQVVPARTVAAARRLVQTLRPVAVVLDVLLEGEHTWDLIGELKRQPHMRGVPVWVVTVVDNHHKALGLGADDFCIKPVDRSWLMTRLHALIRPSGQAKLLLIDDDEASRYLLKGLLADTGYEVVEASRGVDGLQLAEREQPRAIFLDLEMPDLSGVEVLHSLRTADTTRHIPVILHTSKVLTEAERQRLAAKTAAILSKDAPSRDVALARLRQALMRAGLSSDDTERSHV